MGIDVSRKQKAISLREQGLSIKAIANRLGAAQSSVSIWVRGVALSPEQTRQLKMNTHSLETIQKRRQSRLANEHVKRQMIIERSTSEIPNIGPNELFIIGTSLYWAEGGKTNRLVRFSNGDPQMIKIMLRFFREICMVEERKLRVHIHIHEHLNAISAETYWQNVTAIPKEQFFKTYQKPNKSSKGSRNSLPNGVCDIYVLDSKLFLQLQGWKNGICKYIEK